MGILGILGGVFFQVLNSGMILFAKNTAVNAAHEEARQGLNRLTRDIHAAVSVPQLRGIDSAFLNATGNIPIDKLPVVSSNPVGGVPPTSAGVSFQLVHSGPNRIWKDTPNDKVMIWYAGPGTEPKEGMRLIVPLWGVEDDITMVTSEGNHRNVWVSTSVVTPHVPGVPEVNTMTAYPITFYTNRVAYVVKNGRYVADPNGEWILSSGNYVPYTSGTMQRYRYENGELHCYYQRYAGGTFFWEPAGMDAQGRSRSIVARYITSPKPFYTPLNSVGGPNNKYVGVKLTARDPKSSNRNYQATAALLDTQIDYRSRICLYQ